METNSLKLGYVFLVNSPSPVQAGYNSDKYRIQTYPDDPVGRGEAPLRSPTPVPSSNSAQARPGLYFPLTIVGSPAPKHHIQKSALRAC